MCVNSTCIQVNITSLFLEPIRRKQTKVPGLKRNALDYLKDKEFNDRQLKFKELELEEKRLKLEERKISLEERKFEMELKTREETQKRYQEQFQLECAERQHTRNLLDVQQKIIDNLTKNM